MKIIGIDPGFATVGLAQVSSHGSELEVDTLCLVRTKPSARKRRILQLDDDARRLRIILDALEKFWPPEVVDIVVIEASTCVRSAQASRKIALAWGAIFAQVSRNCDHIYVADAREAKKVFCGDIRASKAAMIQRAREIPGYGQERQMLRIPRSLEEHVADAVALASWGIRQ